MRYAISWVFILLRFVLIWRLLHTFSWFALMYVISELWTVAMNGIAVCVGRSSNRPITWLVPVLYMAPLGFITTVNPSHGWGVVLVVVCTLQVLMRFSLGTRLTIGVPIFVSLKADGLYKYVRHPLAFVEILQGLAFVLTFTSTYNVAWFGVLVACQTCVVMLEEHFLRQVLAYRQYCEQVPWRFVKGIW